VVAEHVQAVPDVGQVVEHHVEDLRRRDVDLRWRQQRLDVRRNGEDDGAAGLTSGRRRSVAALAGRESERDHRECDEAWHSAQRWIHHHPSSSFFRRHVHASSE
jgi:hypothetical protein